MTKNNYTISQEYLIRLENECLIEKIAKLEKELAIKILKKDLLKNTYENTTTY